MALLRLTFEEKPAGELVLRPTIPLAVALLCAGCDCLFEAEGDQRCPSCGSAVAMPLAKVLNREPEQAT